MKNGKDILFSAYWSPKGWKSEYEVSEDDLEAAKEQGYMFDYPEAITHGEYMKRLRNAVQKITPEDAANAFLYSLSTRRLEYRSVLGSYWYAAAVPEHEKQGESDVIIPSVSGIEVFLQADEYVPCYLCGWVPWKKAPDKDEMSRGLNILNFERYKWGGVRHTCGSYALFDLEQFAKLEKHPHTSEDEEILRRILDCIYTLEPRDKAAKLQKAITSAKIFKSNKYEVSTLLDILGICGVLSSSDYPCYAEKFCGIYERESPEMINERAYPVNRWRASDGVNLKRYRAVFGKDYVR
ncbi:MAG: hypothetical protein K2K57_04640 [Oscillospiraceae bacterium]|nr:hypothetical protein [Oscillospiraceae bacterium]